jgi:hypothetical protein
MQSRSSWAAGAVAFALAIVGGCSSGSGGTTTAGALDGQWMVWMTVQGQEIGPFASAFSQSGATVSGVGLSGTINGNDFTVTNSDVGGLQVVFTGTLTGTTASGTLSITGSSVAGTFRMQAFQPTGDLSMSGTVGGLATAVNATAACGRREYTDPELTQLTGVELSFDDAIVRVHVDIDAAGLSVGALPVGGGGLAVTLSYDTGAAQVEATANGGTFTVTSYDGNGMAGTYTLQFPGGGSVSGSFDVAWDMNAFVP